MLEKEIKATYKALHDELSEAYYDGTSSLTKEEFDLQHGKIWADMEAELIAVGYLKPPEPVSDLVAEINELKARVKLLEELI